MITTSVAGRKFKRLGLAGDKTGGDNGGVKEVGRGLEAGNAVSRVLTLAQRKEHGDEG